MNPIPQPPVRRRPNARVVWITLSAIGAALVVFFVGVGAGAAGPDSSDAAATSRPTVTTTATTTVTATESVTVTAAPSKRHPSARQTSHAPQPTATRHHRKVPTPTRTRTRTSAPVQHGVHPGAFCSPHGAIGYTSAGTRMRCTTKAGDSGPNGPYWRWRSG